MIRFVTAPDGRVVPDLRGQLPGHGAWLEASAEAVADADRRRLLQKVLQASGQPDDLAGTLEKLLVSQVQQRLAMARRHGAAIGGRGRIDAADGALAGLLVARDASPREAAGLKAQHRQCWVIDWLDGPELGRPFGRESLGYAAVLAGPGDPSAAIRADAARLAGLRCKQPDK